jgi:hypothetical protein
MARRIPPPANPRDGMLVHAPISSVDPHADTVCITFWAGQVDIRTSTNDARRCRALLGRLVHRLAEYPSLVDQIAGVEPKGRAA